MSSGLADYSYLEKTAAQIAALSTTTWTKIGTFPDCLALLGFNSLDAGGISLRFTHKPGATGPTSGQDPQFKLDAGEPLFANYKNIGHMFGACDIYARKNATDPTTGSFRLTGINRKALVKPES